MENIKPSYQPWNEEVFLSDFRVRGMNAVSRWMYRSLLQSAFFHSTRPYLPNNDDALWVLAGAESKEQWLEHKSKVISCFKPAEHDSDLLSNKRLCEDWQKLVDVRTKMAELGAKGGSAKRTFSTRLTPDKQVRDKVRVREKEEGEKSKSSSPLQTYTDNIL